MFEMCSISYCLDQAFQWLKSKTLILIWKICFYDIFCLTKNALEISWAILFIDKEENLCAGTKNNYNPTSKGEKSQSSKKRKKLWEL